jgi:hypothetical protein
VSTARKLAGAAALLLALAGCEKRLAHPFGGYAYEPDGGPDGGCLAASGIVDVIDGPAPAEPCKVLRCWQAPDGTVYVTDQACDAPADYQDHTADTSGPCAAALAAYGADGGRVLCPAAPDGGS